LESNIKLYLDELDLFYKEYLMNKLEKNNYHNKNKTKYNIFTYRFIFCKHFKNLEY